MVGLGPIIDASSDNSIITTIGDDVGSDDGHSSGSDSEHSQEPLEDVIDESNTAFPSSSYDSSQYFIFKEFSPSTGSFLRCCNKVLLPEWQFKVSCASLITTICAGTENEKEGTEKEKDAWITLHKQLQNFSDGHMTCVLVLRSGRFAGAMFDRQGSLLVHKVLRRYTVRAKAGGGQSSHDNKGGKAKSAGAMLRRYGEQALKDDVLEVLRLWGGHLQSCSAIFVAAAKSVRPVLFGSSSATHKDYLDKADPRVKFVPFAVGKPTLEEAKLVHSKITTIWFFKDGEPPALPPSPSHPAQTTAEETSCRSSDSYVGSMKDRHTGSTPDETGKGTVESAIIAIEVPNCPLSKQLLQLCLSSSEQEVIDKLQAIAALFGRQAADIDTTTAHTAACLKELSLPLPHEEEEGQEATSGLDLQELLDLPDSLSSMITPMHIVSGRGFAKAVLLMLQLGANPGKVDMRNKPPYFMARDKETRDAFRRYRAMVKEDRHDWGACGIPVALSEELEMAKKAKEKEKKKKQAQRKKEQKVQEQAQAEEKTEMLRLQEQFNEEERRGREERDKSQAGSCASCGLSLYGVPALEVLDKLVCSSACVLPLRRRLQAEASERRFAKS